MTKEELYTTLRDRLRAIAEEHGLLDTPVAISCTVLTPEQAIGTPKKRDYPILDGAEVMLQADFDGGIGQSFTSTPEDFTGTLREVLELDIVENDYERSVFVAVMNAVMRRLGLCDRSIHCKDDGPEDCARQIVEELSEKYPPETKIAQIGYQPAMLDQLARHFEVRCLDLNPKNVGQVRYGVRVLHGIDDYAETVRWADLILCTGSTLCNATIVDYLDLEKDILYYGTSAAGAAPLLGIRRICHAL